MRSGSAGGQTVQQQPYLYPRLDKGGEEGDVMTASSCSSLDFSPRYFLFIFFYRSGYIQIGVLNQKKEM